MDSHWISSVTQLYQKQTKGSKIFRKILTYTSPIKVKFNLDKWKKKLGTKMICQIEVLNGFRVSKISFFLNNYLILKPDC